MPAFSITFVVRGYHIYKDIWRAEIGSELPCCPEPDNREDRYAVAIMNGTNIVGHVPRKISYICYIFLLHSGSIICRVTGPRQYSQDLEQGGLDVPCEYRFFSKDKRVTVTRKLLELALFPTKDVVEVEPDGVKARPTTTVTSMDTAAGAEVSFTTCSATRHTVTGSTSSAITPLTNGSTVTTSSTTGPTTSTAFYVPTNPPSNSSMTGDGTVKFPGIVKIEPEDDSVGNPSAATVHAGRLAQWIRIGGIKLTLEDKNAIINGQRLNDLIINFAQKVLRQQFPNVRGFQSTLLQEKKKKSNFEQDRVQIIHSQGNHWIVATSLNTTSCVVKVYDSVFDNVDDNTAQLITNLFGSLSKPTTVVIPKQLGSNDCGVYAIANAAALCFGKNPASLRFNQAIMRLHLVECLERKKIALFPCL